MTRSWTFTDLEFVVLWDRLREDRLPHPFVYTTDIPYEDDFQREFVRVRDRLLSVPDPALDEALRDIARPDIAIRVLGVSGTTPDDPAGALRLLATRRESRGHLLTQLPGRTLEHSGGFTIVECDALRLADVVADALPECPAGQGPPLSLSAPAEPDEESDVRLWDSHDEPVDARANAFLNVGPERAGVIEIAQGISRFGPRGRTVRHLHWRDHPDDGRYVITPGQPALARGADRAGLVAAINTELVAVVRAIKDERV
ncbi:ESX secretion-associated protein EspG [Nocardia takedensis]